MYIKVLRKNGILQIFQEIEIDGDPLFESAKTFGNGSHVICPKKFEGKKVLIAVIK
ncbi:DUF2080 family transposase-associated protein [Candidatus Woesearchaeota archaeon]|nr:DUF2080 family transposase-associated protein [Candidatus Woesearchaeota archaeon]